MSRPEPCFWSRVTCSCCGLNRLENPRNRSCPICSRPRLVDMMNRKPDDHGVASRLRRYSRGKVSLCLMQSTKKHPLRR